jgi:hypothetical protein
MADTPAQPNLGYDKTSSTDLNTFNQWFRARPEYYALLQKFGQDPNNVHLNDDQKQQMVRLAQSLGAVVDEGGSGQEVDDSGNFRNKSHKLKTGLIIAGIAGAALATAGAAGLFGGAAAGAGEGAAGAAGLGGVEAGATAGLGATALPGAMATLPAVGLGGVEAGAAAGLGAAALPGAGTALDAGGTLASVGAAAGDAGAFDAAGNFIGESSIPGATGSFDAADAAATAAGGSGLGKALGKGLGTFGDIAGSVGQAIGKANTAAGNNRLNQEDAGLKANAQNITGQSAFEQELMNRAKEEDVQRLKAGKDVYRASYNANPRVSPFDPAGAPVYSKQYLDSAQGLADQGASTLAKPAQYATSSMPALNPYTPIDPKNVARDTNTEQGTLSKIGDYVGPAMSTAQLIAKLWGK